MLRSPAQRSVSGRVQSVAGLEPAMFQILGLRPGTELTEEPAPLRVRQDQGRELHRQQDTHNPTLCHDGTPPAPTWM